MLPSTSGRRLLVVGPVRRIIGCLYFREPLHADGVNFGDPVFEGSAFNVVLHLAIPEGAFHADQLPFLEIPGELGEISPGIDAMHSVRVSYSPLSFFQLSWVAIERMTYSFLFWAVLASAFCPSRPMRMILLNMVWLRFFWLCPLSAVHACPTGVPSRPTPSASGKNLWKGTTACLGGGVRTSKRRAADSWKESVRPKGVGVLSAAR